MSLSVFVCGLKKKCLEEIMDKYNVFCTSQAMLEQFTFFFSLDLDKSLTFDSTLTVQAAVVFCAFCCLHGLRKNTLCMYQKMCVGILLIFVHFG